MYIHMCVYVYIYIWIYVYMYIYICVCMYIYVCIYTYICICIYVDENSVHMYVYIHVCIYYSHPESSRDVFVVMCACACACAHVCMGVYACVLKRSAIGGIHVHICIYVCICIYIYTYICKCIMLSQSFSWSFHCIMWLCGCVGVRMQICWPSDVMYVCKHTHFKWLCSLRPNRRSPRLLRRYIHKNC